MINILLFLIALQAQDPSATIRQVDSQLSQGSVSVNEVLANPSYMKLHPLTAFRAVIKKHASATLLDIVNDAEPGVPTVVKGRLTRGGAPLANTLVYLYQTDHRGWYADTGAHVLLREGDRGHARLFGYLRTGRQGEFELHTIRPASYPNSTLPQHIHLEAFDGNGTSLIITELLFDDDPKLTGATRNEFLRHGFVVAKNTGSKSKQVFSYVVQVR